MMLEKPSLPESSISSFLQEEYGISTRQVTFLPLGYDINTAVYRVDGGDDHSYFLKLRKSHFEPILVLLPEWLSQMGICSVLAPLGTRTQQLFGHLANYTAILYPFIPGKNGYERALSDQQWVELGHTLRMVHETHLPEDLGKSIPSEDYDPRWRNKVKQFLALVDGQIFADPIAQNLAAYMKSQRKQISHMVRRAEELAVFLQPRQMDFVLCHSDAHPGNYLVADTGEVYLVDWDNPLFAPREHDLMCFGSGMSGSPMGGREERLFYQGYGQVQINYQALAYYRYERIIEDLAAFCSQILLSSTHNEEREQSYEYFLSSFAPGHEVEVAIKTDLVKASGA